MSNLGTGDHIKFFCEDDTRAPGFAEGYRAQRLMDAARRSHSQGIWIDFAAEDAGQKSAS